MAPYRMQVELPSITGMAEDKIVNVWHFDEANDVDAEASAVVLTHFYDTVPAPGTHAVGYYLGDSVSRVNDAASIKVYDLADIEPRVPVAERFFTVPDGPGSSVPLPRESACCLSFHGDYTSGSNRARWRGRVYIGPLNMAAVADESTSHELRVTQLFRDDLTEAATELLGNAPLWSVYSRVDDAMRHVIGGWVDNALDTQRRRGLAPTFRQLWPA